MITLERQKIIKILGSLFVAVILVLSYAAYGNSSNSTSTTQSTTINGTAFWSGFNSTVVGTQNLSDVFTIQSNCANQSIGGYALNYTYAIVSGLGNQSVQATQLGGDVLVNSGNVHSQYVYRYVEDRLNASYSRCILFDMKASILLPSRLNFHAKELLGNYAQNALVTVPSNMRSYSLPLSFSDNFTNTTSVQVQALLTQNLQIIPGQVSVTVG